MARRLGWSDDLLQHLPEYEKRADLTEREKTALAFAERMTAEPNRVDEALWARLKQHFDEGEIVELGCVVGLFNYFNRFNNALQMEPTKPGPPQ